MIDGATMTRLRADMMDVGKRIAAGPPSEDGLQRELIALGDSTATDLETLVRVISVAHAVLGVADGDDNGVYGVWYRERVKVLLARAAAIAMSWQAASTRPPMSAVN